MRGGKRPGSGRKRGGANAKTREIADMAAADGVTPLEVMLKAMRVHYEAGRWDDAAERAEKAAPYMHPRLATLAHTGPDGGAIIVKIVRFGG